MPFKRKSSKKRRGGAITLFKEIKASKVVGKKQRSFRAGQRLELRITAPGYIGKVVRYQLKKSKIPSGKEMCPPIGAKKPRALLTLGNTTARAVVVPVWSFGMP